MLTKFMKKNEVEGVLEGKGDFVKIDYLERYLKLMPPIEMRKFAYLKLAEINLNRKSYEQAAKMFRNASLNSVTFREKRDFFLSEAKALIRAQKFEESDRALKRAFGEGNSREKIEAFREIVDFYKEEAKVLEEKNLPGKATKVLEKLIRMKLEEIEKEDIKEKLLTLYERLGKIKEYNFLKTRDLV